MPITTEIWAHGCTKLSKCNNGYSRAAYIYVLCTVYSFLKLILKINKMETLVLVNLILKVVFIFTAFLNMIIILIDYYVCEESFNQSGFFGWFCASLWCFTSFF